MNYSKMTIDEAIQTSLDLNTAVINKNDNNRLYAAQIDTPNKLVHVFTRKPAMLGDEFELPTLAGVTEIAKWISSGRMAITEDGEAITMADDDLRIDYEVARLSLKEWHELKAYKVIGG